MCYTQDVSHLRYKIWSDYNARTSNASDEMMYRTIKSMYIGVKLLYDHGGTSDQDITKGLPTPTIDDSGKVSIGKIQ